MAVIDASVLAAFYISDDPRRVGVAERLTAALALFAPAHIDAEVVSALRGRWPPQAARAAPTTWSAVACCSHLDAAGAT